MTATATKPITRRKQVRNETFKLLHEQGLYGWKVRFNSRMSRALGRCCYGTKTIEYQPRFMDENDWNEVVMTIRHEVAHALTPYSGHGGAWRQKCLELGGNGKQYNTTANLTRKFTGTCEGCKNTWQRDRRMMGAACPPCRRLHIAGETERRYTIVWTRND